jgi:hypothetical protein
LVFQLFHVVNDRIVGGRSSTGLILSVTQRREQQNDNGYRGPYMGAFHLGFSLSPWCMQPTTVDASCQHAKHSRVANLSPTHTFTAMDRKLFEKWNLCQR